jgi:anhydro-N-acetylmuramic acid kinase
MNQDLQRLFEIAKAPSRVIIGLMSGTSLDGLDIALCKFHGSGVHTKVDLLHFKTVSYPIDVKAELKSISSKPIVDLQKVTLINAWLGSYFAKLINDSLKEWNFKAQDVDLIASHGQTIFHAPFLQHKIAPYENATLQIADGDHIAVKTGIITMSDFRQKHVAAGGAGAPLSLYGDYLIFSDAIENRVLLNIGGISNFSFLPSLKNKASVFSTDVGAGNTLMDQYVQKMYPEMQYDHDAALASKGNVNEKLLKILFQMPFFELPFPKTTGPEVFSLASLEETIAAIEKREVKEPQIGEQLGITSNRISKEDVLATLAKFTAQGIINALKATIPAEISYTIYVSGGGMHNPLLIKNLEQGLGMKIISTALLELNPDAKEAVLFALLANECISGPDHTIDGQPAVAMGKISLPN